MMVIPREAGRITYSANIRKMKRIPLDEYQKAIIVGTILGDAYLEANWSKTNYRMGIRHSVDQKEYVQWLYEILKPLVLTPPQYYERTRSTWFRTISHPELSEWQKIFYREGKKVIPETISQYLSNPVTIAVWFMDDGNVVTRKGKTSGYHLNTQSFSESENRLLAEAINELYGIRCTLERNHKYYRLAIYQKWSRDAFATLIRKYLLPSMIYKIG
ncbi:MAG: LAGLIDADG endonuclease [Candidatus Paceibacterota bacterium]|jgi:hypothetical protein